MTRSLPEWVGKTDDTPAPPRVRLRNFEQYGGVCQCGCGVKIRAGDQWQTDHRIALINGGENRESNLVPLLTRHHKKKTTADVAEKSRVRAKRKKHLGIKSTKRKIPYRRFNGEPVNPNRRSA